MMFVKMVVGVWAVTVASGGAGGEGAKAELMPAKLVETRDGLGNVLAKLNRGGEVRVAYIGGSVTGAGGWRVQTFQWLGKQYPRAKLVEINAAIGGTGSDLGVFRYRRDVLDKKPDLVFIEFSINDGGRDPADVRRSVEGMVRQTWQADPTIDLCMVYVWGHGYQKKLASGWCAPVPSAHERIATHYGIPSINGALRIAELIDAGKMVRRGPRGQAKTATGQVVYSHDGVHPRSDTGHQIYTDLIADAIQAMAKTPQPMRHVLKKPVMPDNWEQARLVALEPWMLSSGWQKLDMSTEWRKRYRSDFVTLWEATQPGAAVTFRFKGTALAVYDVIGPRSGKAAITFDGVTRTRQRFDPWCVHYHRRHMFWIAKNVADTEHAVTIAVSPEVPDLTAILKRFPPSAKNADPAKLKGTALRIGYLMVVGDVVRPGH